MKRLQRPQRPQRGAVLIISLILLVVLTALGLSVMQSALVDQMIARNQRDQDTALQAAELAMRAAEASLLDPQNPITWDAFDPGSNNPGLYPETAPYQDAPWESAATWTGNGSIVVNVDNALYAKPPRYIIERIGDFQTGPSMTNPETLRMLRVTAIGYGTSAHAHAVLQTSYRWQ